VDTDAAARAWIEAWDRAWRAKNPAPLAGVYAEDAVFRSHPFREPQSPLVYARGAFEEEGAELELWWNDPVVSGDRAFVEWWATLTENDEPVTLAGASVLRFGADGRVVDQHDYWASAPGHIVPWDSWRFTSEE
jgi:ketosteroid isomerase-like protein